MLIAAFLFISWFLFGLLATVPKKLSNRSLAFGFLFTCFINTNAIYWLSDPFHFFILTHEIQGYVSFCLHQDVIIPCLAVLAANALQYRDPRIKWPLSAGIVALLLVLELVTVRLRIVEYERDWISAAVLGYRLLLVTLAVALMKKISEGTRRS